MLQNRVLFRISKWSFLLIEKKLLIRVPHHWRLCCLWTTHRSFCGFSLVTLGVITQQFVGKHWGCYSGEIVLVASMDTAQLFPSGEFHLLFNSTHHTQFFPFTHYIYYTFLNNWISLYIAQQPCRALTLICLRAYKFSAPCPSWNWAKFIKALKYVSVSYSVYFSPIGDHFRSLFNAMGVELAL